MKDREKIEEIAIKRYRDKKIAKVKGGREIEK